MVFLYLPMRNAIIFPQVKGSLTPTLLTLLLTLGMVGGCGRATETRLIDLAIVGTHDAAAFSASPQLRCQDLTLEEQLEVGVRAFDLRLVDRYDGSGYMDLYHGEESLGLEFTKEVLPLFTQFLTTHPDEFVILSLRKEDDERHSQEEMKAYSQSLRCALERPEVARLLYRGQLTRETKVSEVRGKLLILLRTRINEDVCLPYFDGFQDDTTFVARLVNPCGGTLDLLVEDEYIVSDTFDMSDKKVALTEVLDYAEVMPDHWLIAYLSGTGNATPEEVAEEINPYAYRLLQERKSLPGGIYFVDFAGMPEALAIMTLCKKKNSKI